MPRYMQVTPTFNPMSYEERIKPLEQYKQEYDKQMDTLDEQGMLADAIGGLIDPNQDPELAQIYNNFSNTMNNVAGELLRTGKLGETRRGLRELRTAYANQLVPIQTAYNDRAQAAKEFREAKLKDQTLIGTDPLTHSLKDFMKGKNPNDKAVSGNTLYSMALADTKAASGREFRETAWRLDKNLGSQFFSRIQKEGWSQDEVVQALAGLAGSEDKQISEDATKLMNYLADAHNRIHSLAGIDELKDAANIKEADNYILEGLITGIGYDQKDKQLEYEPYKFEIAKANLEAAQYKAKKAQTDYLKSLGNRTDKPSRTHEETYKGSGNKKLLDKATKEISITNPATGEIVRDAIGAYRALHYNDQREQELLKRKKEIESLNNTEVSKGYQGQFDVRQSTSYSGSGFSGWKRNDTLSEEYNNIVSELNVIKQDNSYRKLLYKPVSLSDKEYEEITKMAGGNPNFSMEDLVARTTNDIEYSNNPVPYLDHELANEGKMSGLVEEVAVDIGNAIRKHPKSEFIYKTTDGINPEGKAIKLDADTFEKGNITTIDVNPFNIATGYISVTTKGKNKGRYLIPIDVLMQEAGQNLLTKVIEDERGNKATRQDIFKASIYGPQEKSWQERYPFLNEGVWDFVNEMATVYGYDIRQMLGATSSKGQFEFNTEE